MEMEEFKPNSHKSKEAKAIQVPEKKIEKAISGTAKIRKKSEARKFADVFIAEDIESVKSYILMDVLVPAVKKAVSDIVTNGIDMILYGESGESKTKSTASKVSYRSYYDNSNGSSSNRRPNSISPHSIYNYDEIILSTRGEAEDIVMRMDEIVETYGMVSVADFYDLVGVTSNYTDNKYGWTDVRNAKIVRVRDGYFIKMPRVMPID